MGRCLNYEAVELALLPARHVDAAHLPHVSTTKPSSWLCYLQEGVRRLSVRVGLNYEAVELALLPAP